MSTSTATPTIWARVSRWVTLIVTTVLIGAVATSIAMNAATAKVRAAHAAIPANECLTKLAAPILTEMGLDGVRVIVTDHGWTETDGFVDVADVPVTDPTVIRVSPSRADLCATADLTTAARLRGLLAHEAGHVAQYRLVNDTRRVRAAVVLRELVVGDLERALGGARVSTTGRSISALEWAADCVAQAYGHPHEGTTYGTTVGCSPADLAAAVAVVEGRWP